MFEDVKSGKINAVVALKLDRISRSVRDWENIMTFLEKYNADLICANDDINTTTANGKMISRIMISVSQNEIERTSERTKIGLSGAIKNGIIISLLHDIGVPNITPSFILNKDDINVLFPISLR